MFISTPYLDIVTLAQEIPAQNFLIYNSAWLDPRGRGEEICSNHNEGPHVPGA